MSSPDEVRTRLEELIEEADEAYAQDPELLGNSIGHGGMDMPDGESVKEAQYLFDAWCDEAPRHQVLYVARAIADDRF